MQEVARQAGVSLSTVSKAFNNTGRLSPQTRQRVLKAAAELHFRPNALIRSLQVGKTFSIGVYTWDFHVDPSFDITMHLTQGIAEGIAAARYDMIFFSHFPERTPDSVAATCLDGRADGVIIGPLTVEEAGLNAMAAAKLPTVALYRREVPEGVGYVAIDNASGIAAVMDHLVGLGHQRIAYFAPMVTFDYAERKLAFKESAARLGLERDSLLCIQGQIHVPSIEPACEQLLEMSDAPTALIAGDDCEALRWIQALSERGIRVPEDISVVGFDDTVAAASVGLTTVRQDARTVGRTAAEFVKALIDGAPVEDCRVLLPVELVVRGTTAPPRKRGKLVP